MPNAIRLAVKVRYPSSTSMTNATMVKPAAARPEATKVILSRSDQRGRQRAEGVRERRQLRHRGHRHQSAMGAPIIAPIAMAIRMLM